MNIKILKTHTLDEYLKLSREDRTTKKWYWLTDWYLYPLAMEWHVGGDSEFTKIDKWLGKEYPLQFFIRDTLPEALDDFKDWVISPFYKKYGYSLWEKFRNKYFTHNNKWAHEAVDYIEYHDKTEMIPNFLFAAIVDFIEGEEAFERILWEEGDFPKVKKQLEEIYNYIKKVRPYLEKRELKGYDFASANRTLPFKQQYRYVHFYEQLKEKSDTKYMNKIIELRGYLWT
jgi:hypothetical protein